MIKGEFYIYSYKSIKDIDYELHYCIKTNIIYLKIGECTLVDYHFNEAKILKEYLVNEAFAWYDECIIKLNNYRIFL